jgi:hypothetical protein
MPINVDSITYKRLVLVKRLYQQALVQSTSQHDLISSILSVIGFDLAIETMLKTIVSSLDPSRTLADSFQSVIQQADVVLDKEKLNPIPDKGHIYHVHTIRNNAQHKASYPSGTEVNDCRTYTRDFLQKVTLQVWDLQFDDINLSDLVQDKKAKELLKNAEDALDKNDYKKATEQAIAAFAWVFYLVGNHIVGPSDSNKFSAIGKMQEAVLITTLGLNYAKYIRYREVVTDLNVAAYFTISGQGPTIAYGILKDKKIADATDAEFLIAYVTDSIVQIESQVGSLDNPFNRKRRSLG